MATPAQFVEQKALADQQAARDRKNQLQDEQRKATLKTLLEDAETPQDKVAAIQAVYHEDPGVLKQHVENLTRRMTGKQPQPVVSPQQAQQRRIAPIAARGKTPDQQALEFNQKQGEISNQQRAQLAQQEAHQKQQEAIDLINKYVPPDQRQAALEDYARKQSGIATLPKNIPGAGGQPYRDPETGKIVRPVQLADGTVGKQEMPAGYQLPAPKPSSQPKAGVSHGRNVYALLTPKGWVDAGTGKPLDDFRPLPNYAEIAPSMRAVQVVDPNDPTSTVYESIPEAIKNHSKGTQSVDYKLQMPTGQERGRAQLANSSVEQIQDMEGILRNRGDLFGPASGRYTNFTEWVGSQDPDAQRFRAAARIAADHLAGVFGGRSQAALDAIYSVVGQNTTNPAAAIAGLEQMSKAASNIQRSGGGPAPRSQQHKVGDRKKFPNGRVGVWDGTGWVAQ